MLPPAAQRDRSSLRCERQGSRQRKRRSNAQPADRDAHGETEQRVREEPNGHPLEKPDGLPRSLLGVRKRSQHRSDDRERRQQPGQMRPEQAGGRKQRHRQTLNRRRVGEAYRDLSSSLAVD